MRRPKKKPRPKPGLSSTDRLADQKSRWMRRRARHSSSLFVVNGQAEDPPHGSDDARRDDRETGALVQVGDRSAAELDAVVGDLDAMSRSRTGDQIRFTAALIVSDRGRRPAAAFPGEFLKPTTITGAADFDMRAGKLRRLKARRRTRSAARAEATFSPSRHESVRSCVTGRENPGACGWGLS